MSIVAAERSLKTRSVMSNGHRLHPRNIDGRSTEARRFRDLVESFAEPLGGLEDKPSRANAISARRSSSFRKPPRIMRPSESGHIQMQAFSRFLNESGYSSRAASSCRPFRQRSA